MRHRLLPALHKFNMPPRFVFVERTQVKVSNYQLIFRTPKEGTTVNTILEVGKHEISNFSEAFNEQRNLTTGWFSSGLEYSNNEFTNR